MQIDCEMPQFAVEGEAVAQFASYFEANCYCKVLGEDNTNAGVVTEHS